MAGLTKIVQNELEAALLLVIAEARKMGAFIVASGTDYTTCEQPPSLAALRPWCKLLALPGQVSWFPLCASAGFGKWLSIDNKRAHHSV